MEFKSGNPVTYYHHGNKIPAIISKLYAAPQKIILAVEKEKRNRNSFIAKLP